MSVSDEFVAVGCLNAPGVTGGTQNRNLVSTGFHGVVVNAFEF